MLSDNVIFHRLSLSEVWFCHEMRRCGQSACSYALQACSSVVRFMCKPSATQGEDEEEGFNIVLSWVHQRQFDTALVASSCIFG